MADHHNEGMSRWTAFAECPYYASKESTTAASNFGTRAHAALEALIKGDPLPAVTADEREVAEWAHDWLVEYIGGRAEIHSETRVEIKDPGAACDGIFGTCDVWFVIDGQLHVADFKSLGYSDRDHSPQLKGYAYALMTDPAVKFDSTKPVKGIILHGGNRFASECEFTVDDAAADGNRIIREHRAATEESACPCASCQFCSHYPCAAVNSQLVTIEKRWMPADISRKLELADMCERFAKAVKEEARGILDHGGIVQGWELATRKGSAPLEDIDGLAGYMIGGLGVDRTAFLASVKVSKTALLDLAVAASGESKKKITADISRFFGDAPETKILKRITNNKKGKK